jgi:hypothetical protein
VPYALDAAKDTIGDRLAILAGVCGLDVTAASDAEATDAFLAWLDRPLADKRPRSGRRRLWSQRDSAALRMLR